MHRKYAYKSTIIIVQVHTFYLFHALKYDRIKRNDKNKYEIDGTIYGKMYGNHQQKLLNKYLIAEQQVKTYLRQVDENCTPVHPINNSEKSSDEIIIIIDEWNALQSDKENKIFKYCVIYCISLNYIITMLLNRIQSALKNGLIDSKLSMDSNINWYMK